MMERKAPMKYARLIQFPVKAGNRDWSDGIADQFKALMESQPGFVHVTFLRIDKPDDGTDDIMGALSVWQSRDHAVAVGEALGPALRQHGDGYLTGPPTVTLYEAYEPE
jgi:heme-degrading monooxygenase HmoA